MNRTLDQVASRHAVKLRELQSQQDAGAPQARLEQLRRVVDELALTYQALYRVLGAESAISHFRGTVSDRVYVFVRGGMLYECTHAPLVGSATWTIRTNGCEAEGPDFLGWELSDVTRAEAFEDLAVEAIKSCTKSCALR